MIDFREWVSRADEVVNPPAGYIPEPGETSDVPEGTPPEGENPQQPDKLYGFTVMPQQAGDLVYFGAHDLLKMPDDRPLSVAQLAPNMAVIQYLTATGAVVSPPQTHKFTKKTRMRIRQGNLVLPPEQLHEIDPEFIDGTPDTNPATGNPVKLWLYTPNEYTRWILAEKNTRMRAAKEAAAAPPRKLPPVTGPQPVPAPPRKLPPVTGLQPAAAPGQTSAAPSFNPNDFMARIMRKKMESVFQDFIPFYSARW